MPEEVPGVASQVLPGNIALHDSPEGDRGGGGEVGIALHVRRSNQCPIGVQGVEDLGDSDSGDPEPVKEGKKDEALSLGAQYPEVLWRPGRPVPVASGRAASRACDHAVTGRIAMCVGAHGGGSPAAGNVGLRAERGGGNRLGARLLLLSDRAEFDSVRRRGCFKSSTGNLRVPRGDLDRMIHIRS